MGSRVRWWVVIGSALAALFALSVSLSACGSSGESTDRSFHEAFHEWKTSRAMSETMTEEAISAAEEAEVVKRLLAGQTVKSAEAARFVGTDGKTLIGAAVTLHLAHPIDMEAVEVPVWLTPGPHPSKPPLPIERFARYTGTGIDELKLIVSMPTKELLELQPFGASVNPPELTAGSIPGYKKVGEH